MSGGITVSKGNYTHIKLLKSEIPTMKGEKQTRDI
jgi:hypothetical protein